MSCWSKFCHMICHGTARSVYLQWLWAAYTRVRVPSSAPFPGVVEPQRFRGFFLLSQRFGFFCSVRFAPATGFFLTVLAYIFCQGICHEICHDNGVYFFFSDGFTPVEIFSKKPSLFSAAPFRPLSKTCW